MSDSPRFVFRYYLYQITLSLGFYVPVSVVYLRDLGFSLRFVGLAWATFSVALLAAEIPTGYLGDRLGHRWVLVFGSLCRVVGIGGYALAEHQITFLALKVFTGVGWALRSGTSDAYLYELLQRETSEERFTRIKGRGKAVQLTTSAVTALAGGVLYAAEPTIPFVATAVLAALDVPALLSLPELDGVQSNRFTVRRAARTVERQVRRPDVRWMVAYGGLVSLAFATTRTFEQPALRAIGIDAAGLGALYAAFKLVSAAGGAVVGTLAERLGTRSLLALVAPTVGVAYAGLLAAPAFLFPVAFFYRFTRNLLLPIQHQYLNDRLEGVGRATVLSGVSMLLSLAGAVVRFVGSELVGVVGPIDLLGFAGVGFAAAATVVWLATASVRDAVSWSRDASA